MKKTRKSRLWNGAALLAAAAVCLLSLQLPKIWGRWCDERLLNAPMQRPLVDGMLGPEGEKSPLLKALYKKRCLSDEYSLRNDTKTIDCSRDELRKQADVFIANLGRSGVIPQQAICEIGNFQMDELWRSSEELGFRRLDSFERGLDIQWHQKTELVIHYRIEMKQSSVPEDVSQFLACYQEYLGIAELDDWKVVGEQEGPTQARWSEKGQAYLHCSWKPESFEIGIISLPPAEIENMY